MIQLVLENLRLDADHVFIVREGVEAELRAVLEVTGRLARSRIVVIPSLTEGAACTVLLAEPFFAGKRLLVINCDQMLEWDAEAFLTTAQVRGVDGLISTFTDDHPKWSFAATDSGGRRVTRVAEKEPISDHATTGIYYWRNGSDYAAYTRQMIAKNIRVKNEFYVCPVYNEAIEDGKCVEICDCAAMWGIGVPEDLETFIASFPYRHLL